MRSRTSFLGSALLLGLCVSSGGAQQPVKDQTPSKPAAGAQAGSVPVTETIPQPPPIPQPRNAPGFMEPAEVQALAHKIWMAEFRINDLLTQVHPEKWKASNIARNTFIQTLDNLHRALDGLEEWRAQFERRPDSLYFGFQTYAAMSAALPRLSGISRTAGQFENSSLGAQYDQAGNQLFDLEQALQPYIAYLLRNPDQALTVAQTNLAGCQKQLGNALRGQTEPATPLKNTFVEFHGRQPGDARREHRASSPSTRKKSQSQTEKKTDSPTRKPASP